MRCWWHIWEIRATPKCIVLPSVLCRECRKCGKFQVRCDEPGWAVAKMGWQDFDLDSAWRMYNLSRGD